MRKKFTFAKELGRHFKVRCRSVATRFLNLQSSVLRTVSCLAIFAMHAAGCQQQPASAVRESPQVVAFDSKSKQAYVVETDRQLPFANPENPRSQLQPALYCSACQRWYPAPPMEVLNRTPGASLCQKDGTQLSPDGPRPQETLRVESLED